MSVIATSEIRIFSDVLIQGDRLIKELKERIKEAELDGDITELSWLHLDLESAIEAHEANAFLIQGAF